LYSCYSGVVKSICPRHAAKQIGVSENEVAIKPEVAKQEQAKQITELNQEIQDLEK
jgi:Na+-translocating ferredoxin:NAD+ oxidoreductase RnfC subunit